MDHNQPRHGWTGCLPWVLMILGFGIGGAFAGIIGAAILGTIGFFAPGMFLGTFMIVEQRGMDNLDNDHKDNDT